MSATKPSILLVDDDERFRTQLGRAFERRNYEVRLAGDFTEAVANARSDSPEFAVLDLQMPGESGLELLRSLKAIDEGTQILILTGYGSIATAIDAVRLGACNYVPKPADVDQIIAAFEKGEKQPLCVPDTPYQPASLARIEWEHINRVLSDCGGNISQAARVLGLHRRTLQRKLQKYPPQQ